MRAGANAEREFVEAGVLLRSVTGFDATCKHRGREEEGRGDSVWRRWLEKDGGLSLGVWLLLLLA